MSGEASKVGRGGSGAIVRDSSTQQNLAGKTGPEICLLLAAERSGTHLLRSLLGNVHGVAAPPEICNATMPLNRANKSSFFRFKERACIKDPEFFFPTEPVQRRFLDGFTDFLTSSHAGNALILLDVKYAHVHNFNFFWWDPLDVPYLLQYAKRKPIKIVHLVRRKVYRTAISGFYAKETGVWRARNQEQTRQISIRVDPRKLERKALLLARTIRCFETWLSACPHFQISYEALTEDRAATLELLQEYLGLQNPILDDPGFVKTTPPLEDSIENYREIAHFADLDLEVISSSWPPRKNRRAPFPGTEGTSQRR